MTGSFFYIFVAKLWQKLRTGHPFDRCEEVRKDVLHKVLELSVGLLFWQPDHSAQYILAGQEAQGVCYL